MTKYQFECLQNGLKWLKSDMDRLRHLSNNIIFNANLGPEHLKASKDGLDIQIDSLENVKRCLETALKGQQLSTDHELFVTLTATFSKAS